jgi:hypothetical protein
MNNDIPLIFGFIEGVTKQGETLEAIIHALRTRQGKVLTFHAHTSSGANYSLIPIHKLKHKEHALKLPPQALQAWDCFSDSAEVHVFSYFQFRRVLTKDLGEGEYLFTIDFKDNQFSDYPPEFKQFHFIKLDNGRFAALPNNYLLFQEKTFTGLVEWKDLPNFVRQEQEDYKSVEI